MRDLAKSMLSFSWALPLLGVQQVANLLVPQNPAEPLHRAARAFGAVTRAAEGQLGGTLGAAFRGGDQIQRAVVDMMLGVARLDALDPSSVLRATADAARRSADALRDAATSTERRP